ncbi:Kynurenine/alpha-aminoadipate aminotransferase, mitochondrial [Portunus trituberculatus]|uniref:Kynurenine/alpha-aminoadipate aminotransferase, mitochondrial n=1 Tax=Portunus trituberculatus TaxID=210409 RepID=A0A5B7CLL0_PORTR|nr:Kynurenine/alpha-aminoadipate aminotransferase, mitochondrial [Portunus trituberculatus]
MTHDRPKRDEVDDSVDVKYVFCGSIKLVGTTPYQIRGSSIKPSTSYDLSSGLPNPELFPFKEATFVLQSGEALRLSQQLTENALQYGPSYGYVGSSLNRILKFLFSHLDNIQKTPVEVTLVY